MHSIVHSGKARRGDGNDLTPNPRKLHSIGRELDKLNRLINDMTPVSELPMAVRPKSRKEKNKLASRFVCVSTRYCQSLKVITRMRHFIPGPAV